MQTDRARGIERHHAPMPRRQRVPDEPTITSGEFSGRQPVIVNALVCDALDETHTAPTKEHGILGYTGPADETTKQANAVNLASVHA